MSNTQPSLSSPLTLRQNPALAAAISA